VLTNGLSKHLAGQIADLCGGAYEMMWANWWAGMGVCRAIRMTSREGILTILKVLSACLKITAT